MESKVIKTVTAKDIPIQDLTEVILDGNGVFDKFLTLHRKVLDREFNQARIVGKEYSDAFTQTYIANMELAIRFLMEKEKQAYEIELLEGQKAQLDKELAIKDYELTNNLPLQTKKLEHENCILETECKTKKYNLEFILPKELEIKDAQMRKIDADAKIALKQLDILTKEFEEKLPAEIRLMEAQADKMRADAEIAEKQILLADKELQLKDKELELIEEQLALQKQKVITERAQTEAGVAEEGSIIATNVDTLKSQMLGIERDAKQKVLQLMLSTWTTRKNNDSAIENYQNLLTDDVIGAVVQDALHSIGYQIDIPDGEPGPRPTTPTSPDYTIP